MKNVVNVLEIKQKRMANKNWYLSRLILIIRNLKYILYNLLNLSAYDKISFSDPKIIWLKFILNLFCSL